MRWELKTMDRLEKFREIIADSVAGLLVGGDRWDKRHCLLPLPALSRFFAMTFRK